MKLQVKMFYDEYTSTLSYVVYNPDTKDAIIIDPVLNYEEKASEISFESINEILSFVDKNKLNVYYSLETHAHADHIAGSSAIRKLRPDIKIGIGENIKSVQNVFKEVFNFKDLKTDGSQFDVLLTESKPLNAGTIEIKTIYTPGHTPACSSYLIEDMVFTGDALFMPDYGTGRCDFPKGSAKDLYYSVHEKLYNLADTTKVYVGHDYKPNGRDLRYQTTIAESKENNIRISQATTEDEFVTARQKRDSTLKPPRLLLPSIQVNIDAGNLPKAEDNHRSYLKIPLNIKD